MSHISPGNLYIDGKWVPGNGAEFSSTNPATGQIIWRGAMPDDLQIDAAVAAGYKAQASWAELSFGARLKILNKFKDLITERRDELANILAMENGKPLWEAQTELGAMINKLPVTEQSFAERCPERDGVGYKPHGLVVVFGPFNFPGHLPNGHIMPALLAGNTVILKPSELTPLITEAIIKCWDEVGLPPGVLNVLYGDAQVGKYLLSARHREIRGVFFTGSSAVGMSIQQASLQYPERIVALEMGGNNPLVVHDCKDLAAASYHTIQSAYITAGQRCTCARRLIVPEGQQGRAFVAQLIQMIQQIQVGIYTDSPEPFMGPLITRDAANKIIAAMENLANNGAEILLPCKLLDEHSALLTPGLIDVTAVTDRTDQEYFGPLLQLIWVKDFAAAIAEANNTEYGLSAGILSDSRACYEQFYQQVEAGIINWNRPITGASGNAPFGGVGKSGNYRPSAYYAVDYCTYPVARIQLSQLSMPQEIAPGLYI